MDECELNVTEHDRTPHSNAEEGPEIAGLVAQVAAVNRVVGLLPRYVDARDKKARILDLGCGPGTWAHEVAYALPSAAVIGFDISSTLVRSAQTRAISQNIQNSSFEVKDALKHLPDVSSTSFDLIHLCFAAPLIPREHWLPLLKEGSRLLKPGGSLISTEGEWPYTTSEALYEINRRLSKARHTAGLGLIAPDGESQGVIARMGSMLYHTGFSTINVEASAINFSFFTNAHKIWCENFLVGLRLATPLLLTYQAATEKELAWLHSEMVQDMWEPGFCGIEALFTY